ncbi:MAG: F0F1 ATP synthase subunit B [bacterium]
MQESFSALGLDFRQVITNIFGFLIFWWLMRRFAWDPILKFMDSRRDDISGNFRKLDLEREEIGKIRTDYETKLAKIDEEATHRIQGAIRQGQNAARQIEDEARAKAMSILGKARSDTERILEEAKLDLKNYVVEIGVEAGKKAAMGALDEKSHRKLVEQFVEEISNVR